MRGLRRFNVFICRLCKFNVSSNILQAKNCILKEFRRLKRRIKWQYYEIQTLSERFKLKEIETVLKALAPIMLAFTLLVILCGSLVIFVAYLNIVKHEPLGTPLTQALVNVRSRFLVASDSIYFVHFQGTYIFSGVYNMFATVYLTYSLCRRCARFCAQTSAE